MLVWNGIVASVPALVLRPTSPEEIAAAVAYARGHGLLLRVKGVSDEGPETALAERCLTLDLSLVAGAAATGARDRKDHDHSDDRDESKGSENPAHVDRRHV